MQFLIKNSDILVFIPGTIEDLTEFQEIWDNHPLRIAQNRTPSQL